jgi:hypothetical protein
VTSGTVRIIDLMFIKKDADDHTQALEVKWLAGADALRYQTLAAAIDDLIHAEDIEIAAAGMSPDSIAAVLGDTTPLLRGERDGEPERRTRAENTLDADTSPHLFDELTTDE